MINTYVSIYLSFCNINPYVYSLSRYAAWSIDRQDGMLVEW